MGAGRGVGPQVLSSSCYSLVPLVSSKPFCLFSFSVYPTLPSVLSPLLCPLIQPPVPGPCRATHLCPRPCSGPRSARRRGGCGLCAAGGAAGSLRGAPSPGSSRPGAGPWGPARRPSASWGWCLRWSGGDRPADGVSGWHQGVPVCPAPSATSDCGVTVQGGVGVGATVGLRS